MTTNFFAARPDGNPIIYAYILPDIPSHNGFIKVGYTSRTAEERINEQTHTAGLRYKILHQESAMRSDGTCFTDKDVHAVLKRKGFLQLYAGEDDNEWYQCTIDDVKAAIIAVKTYSLNMENRSQTFKMRPEQYKAVQMTEAYYRQFEEQEPNRPPKFLWNAKMRFGKTFAAYQLSKRMGFKKILILTFKPAVESAWMVDLQTHVDFEGWQFVSNKDAHQQSINIDEAFERTDQNRPVVVFGSFQDLLGTNSSGGIKAKNEFIHITIWDLVIFDEYHFGAWKENAKKLFENPDEEEESDFDQELYKQKEADNAYNETFLPITTTHYLFLSGTPFRAINAGEFIEDQIYNWTYSDEQQAKENWIGSGNPYLSLPRMVMMTYQIPEEIRQIAMGGEYNEFDLNVFFSAKVEKDQKIEDVHFKYETEVAKWLALIRGAYLPSSIDDLRLGQDKRPPMPFSDARLLKVLNHTFWYLPNVASCYAMFNLLKNDHFFSDYNIVLCAGTKAGIGVNALPPVLNAMGNPLETKTITLSCGKLNTGVTVRPWTGVFMLRNLKSPETYFQTAFRAQSPWTITDDNGKQQIMKKECYLFDFALNRALRQISDYSCRLSINEDSPEKKVAEFIHFLPVLAYDGATMKPINAQDVLDIALAGTSATLLARRWESALLVNVDNDTLTRLMNNQEALDALMRIEGFRSLNKDIEKIINKSDKVKKAKRDGNNDSGNGRELSKEEKEYKRLRKDIQKKLIKFATRIPVFMYLTDYREETLKHVITQLEPGLFKKVTGLNVRDFELLCSIGVFNANLMNDAIFKFKRYEDSSLSYAGINKHLGENVGGWDTVIKREEYEKLFYNQQASMENMGDTVSLSERLSESEFEIVAFRDLTTKSEVELKAEIPINQRVNLDHSAVPYKVPTNLVGKVAESQPVLDLSKVMDGTGVTHKKFGRGVVTKVDHVKNYVFVKFSGGEKQFPFPAAFKEGKLKLQIFAKEVCKECGDRPFSLS